MSSPENKTEPDGSSDDIHGSTEGSVQQLAGSRQTDSSLTSTEISASVPGEAALPPMEHPPAARYVERVGEEVTVREHDAAAAPPQGEDVEAAVRFDPIMREDGDGLGLVDGDPEEGMSLSERQMFGGLFRKRSDDDNG
ncbi:MAG: hypothetical protein HQL50_08165 [Magnetococcales bacterium]|nr:hypothetical protein [Magnetococcales bacterium]